MRCKYLIVALVTSLLAAAPALADEDRMRVVVIPFEEISANPSQPWMGQAISQSIVAELSQLPEFQPTVGNRSTSDAERARQVGRAAGADYVVTGGYQLLDPQLRITGQVIAVQSGKVVGGLKATGTVRDFFGMQDSLAAQAKRILRPPAQPPAANQTPADAPQVGHRPIESSGPIRISTYHGSTLQQAVRAGGVYQAQPAVYDQPRYTNYVYGYGYAWPHPAGYYGLPLYWGYPPPVTRGHWPVWPAYRYWYPGRVIIKKHGRHHRGDHHVHSGASIQIRMTN